MLKRLHISSFIVLTIFIWAFLRWLRSVLSIDFINPFGFTVSMVTVLFLVFDKWAWSLKIFKGWYVKRPYLVGTWKVEMNSSWVDPETGKGSDLTYGYVAIGQSLTFLSIILMTKESRSVLVAHNIEPQESNNSFKLAGVYRNEPAITLRGVRSEIHYGSFSLEVHGCPVYELEGHYWTDRLTKGSMKLSSRTKKIYDTYEQAEREIGNYQNTTVT